MKDLRECGEVGPSENGEPQFSCLFCAEKLNAMELIVDHINYLHKDKITFKPDALKKRPRRKRKSELPVSEWINLEKDKGRRINVVTSDATPKDETSSINYYKYEENEESYDQTIRTTKVVQGQYTRSRRKNNRKLEDKENEIEISNNSRNRTNKDNLAVVSTESEDEMPIKIKLKRKGQNLVVENDEHDQVLTKVENSCEIQKNKEAEPLIASIPINFPQIDYQYTKEKINQTINFDIEAEPCEKLNVLKEDPYIENEIKNENDENNSIKNEIQIENEYVEQNSKIIDPQSVDNKRYEVSESESDSEVEFSENSINNSSEDENSGANFDSYADESSFSDSDSEITSNLKCKSKTSDIAIEENFIIVNSPTASIDSSKQSALNENQNIAAGRMKQKRCTPKSRKMNEFGEYVCDICGNTYKKATSLSRHRSDCREGKMRTSKFRTRKENGMFPCNYEDCAAEYQNVEEVFKHEKEIHGKKKYARPQVRNKNEFGEYVCDICGNIYKKGTSLSRHRALCREGIVIVPKRKKRNRLRNEKGLYPCVFNSCTLEFLKVEEVLAHEKSTHKGGKKKKVGRMCEVCGKWLTSACSFKAHMLRHSGERNYKCDQCPGAFYDKYALTLHKKIHNENKDFECEYCNKKFTRSIEMRKHIRYIHLNLRPEPVMCDLCGKYFHWRFDLKSHMRRHYNIKTIHCEFAECEQMFANRSDLKKHLITHNPDIKPWQCEICSNSFSRKSTLVKHQKLHTGSKDYTCSICGKAFAQSPGLYMHMKSHGFNLKPEGAGRYERLSHIGYKEMDPSRISNSNFKENSQLITIKQAHMPAEVITKDESPSIKQDGLNGSSANIPGNPIATIHIESINGVLTSNIANPTITTIGNEIQINLAQPIHIDLGQITQSQNH